MALSYALPKFTIIITTKRHYIPEPGILLESEVCHPFYWDFYLCAHSAIKGTARPVHYTVLLEESGMNPAALQMMIYQHSYQYMRSTTPVSLHPAIYYADLACGHARSHKTVTTSKGFLSGTFRSRDSDRTLEALRNVLRIRNWT